MKKKDLKLIIIGAIIILCGALMFFDKIAEIAKLDTTQVPFGVVNTISTPFVSIRKSIRNEDILDNYRNEINEEKEKNNQLQENLNDTNKKLDRAESKASQWKYFYVKVNNAPLSWGGNSIAVVSTSHYTFIPKSRAVVFIDGSNSNKVEWINGAVLSVRKLNNNEYKELPSLDYNDFAKNYWAEIGK